MNPWSEWQSFPDPSDGGYLYAPFGPGVYELRNGATGEYVLFGRSQNVAHRMSSLLPVPIGCGNRHNSKKRQYVLEHLKDIEYRTLACQNDTQASEEERNLKYSGKSYLFKR
jgi:hypothetical protein